LHYARQLIRENEILIVDGTQGVIIVDPDPQALAEYKLRQHQWDLERQKLKRLRNTRATTLDDVEVELQANIELPEDVEQVRENGATGIGLFRTEFLFLNRDNLPDENEQFEAYRKVVRAMDGLPVTIRTYDLGADKHINGVETATTNPALGLRAIRLSLTEPQMFLVQLRAMLRASHYGKLKILIPMLMSASEIDQALNLIAQARQNLEDRYIPYDRRIEIGGMIEIPAAALAISTFIRKLDFLSIGTNDLIQYTLAIDRTDDTVSHLYDPLHPAVLNLIAYIIKTCNKAGKPIACAAKWRETCGSRACCSASACANSRCIRLLCSRSNSKCLNQPARDRSAHS
jgi:phosphotransferase system enzyme I (PtsI)